jgi:superfamily II DNA or RNA helicase
MSIASQFLPAFQPSTLQQLELMGAKLRVKDPLFFRAAYTAFVIENERRTYSPVAVIEGGKIGRWWCTCSEQMRYGDLCRHLAVVMRSASDDDGILANERYESSFWRSVGYESFSEARPLAEHEPDTREVMLRRYALTAQEQELVRRGAGSTRLQWEASPWYRWSKARFLRHGDVAGSTIRLSGGEVTLVAGSDEIGVPRNAVEYLVEAGVAAASGFEVERDSLTPSLRVELTPERALRFTPVLLSRDGAAHDRQSLTRFGRFFLDGAVFRTPRAVPPLFGESSSKEQSSLFDMRRSGGLPFDRETVIAEAEVMDFVQRHRRVFASLPPSLAEDAIRQATTLSPDDEVLFDFAPANDELLDLAITFRSGSDSISAREIATARKAKIRVLVHGNLWLDTADPQFAWIDHARFFGESRLLLTKLEYLRIRGLVRGRAVFSGDSSGEQVFRIFDDLQNASGAPSPADLGMDLYGYQQTGYQWLWLLQQNGFGGLLCDDMGLGKTHQAMALIRAVTRSATLRKKKKGEVLDEIPSILVVCPTSVLDHWREKLKQYIPDVRFHVHHGAGRDLGNARAILTSFGVVRSDFDQLRSRRFDLLVLDEIQTIKNPETATHQALRSVDFRVAIGLTGTPVENHERELKALLDFVVPGYLPKEVPDRASLQRLVRPFVLRRTKAQVLPELPPKIVDKRYCELSPHQRAMYRAIIESRARPLRAQLRAGAKIPYIHVFAALNYLKQICNHPASVGGGMAEDGPSGKWDLFCELLEECMTSGLKVVVFSQYISMLELIERHLQSRNIGFASIKGSTRDRGAEVRRFRDDDDCRVFTASLRAAGLGIDLTSASVVIHYDRWWNQAREDQATDRVHRLGQNKGVQVIKLITRNSVEEKIDQLVEQKAGLAQDLIRPDDPTLVKQFTPEELDQLLEWEE